MAQMTRFTAGTGCYTCRVCGRKTRATDRDAAARRQCAQCWDLAGLENEQLDGRIDAQGLATIDALRADIVRLGGKL
jgi:hypothetical protein